MLAHDENTQRSYSSVLQQSREDRERFWLDAAQAVDWGTAPSRALTQTSPIDWRWYADASLNICANTLDRHVDAGRGDRAALIYDSAMTGDRATFSYRELRDSVATFAGALRDLGVQIGDRVLIYLPMTPQAVIAMLACARIGAVHSVVFGGFAANELATRVKDARPRVIVTSSGGLEPGRTVEYLPMVAEALEICGGAASGVETVIVHDRATVLGNADSYDGRGGVNWKDWVQLQEAAEPVAPVQVRANDPLYILYTSGTTGSPKGVVRDTGGYAVALSWAMRNIYDIDAGDTMFTASDVGWVVGHSFIVYGPLLVGATTVLYEGKPVGTPDPGSFWRVISENKVKTLFTAPTALRAIRREDPELLEVGTYDLSTLEALYVAGERMDPETWHWIKDGLGVPVIDHWWQTETGWPICAIPRGIEALPAKAGSTAVPMPGYDVRILDSEGAELSEVGAEGNIALRTPLPPGALLEIWGNKDRFREAYLSAFPGYYATGDAGYIDEDGYLFVMGRTDDVINVAGHRLSTGSLEEVLTQHPAVAECAVVGARDDLKGQRAEGFVTLKHGASISHEDIAPELVRLVREKIGPVAAFRSVTVVERLPKTRSGKILRKTIRQIVDGEPHAVPATIEDPAVIDSLIAALSRRYSAPPTTTVRVQV